MEKTTGKSPPGYNLPVIFIISLLPFLAVEIFRPWLYRVMDSAAYLTFHNVAELFSVLVSLAIFSVGWYTYEQSGDRHALFLSTAFLAIGLMDFMHTLGYAGMPDFITPNSANKSTQFWIAVRAFSAGAFLTSAYIFPDSRSRWLTKPFLLSASLTITTLVFIGVIFQPNRLPATFVEGVGLTPFKKVSEFLIIILLALAIRAYRKRANLTGDKQLFFYPAAFLLCIFSELVFALYKSVFDTFNVIGHIYKVAAFYLVYQGIFTASIKLPYAKLLEKEDDLRRDIAERKRAEEALSKAKEEWELTFNAISDPIMILDIDCRIVKTNKAMTDVLGVDPSDIKGLTCYQAVHGTETRPSFCPYALLLADGLPHSVELKESRLGGYFVVTVSPLYDPRKKLLGCVHYMRDITERKLSEEALRKSEERFRSLALATTQIIWITDATGELTEDMPMWRVFTGQSAEDIKGLGWSNALHPDDRQRTTEIWSNAVRTRTLYDTEYRLRRYDGKYRFFAVRGVPVSEINGDIREWIGTCTDITEHKLAEDEIRSLNTELEQRVQQRTAQLEAANRELEAFSYSVSHDLRAPLRAIDGFSLALLEDCSEILDEQGKSHLGRVRAASQRMANLIDDILKLSRITRGEMKRELVDLSTMAHSLADSLQKTQPERRVEFCIQDDLIVRGDKQLLMLVLENLIGNAWKFTSHNETARIEFGAGTTDDKNAFFVRDNGAGFDMKYVEKLFSPFQRLHSAEEFEGTGIGLSIVQRIIHRHGGKTWAEGSVTKGATFYFTLPRELETNHG